MRRSGGLDKTAQNPGWDGDLVDLARETQQLLASVHRAPNPGSTRRENRGGRNDETPKKSKTKRRRKGTKTVEGSTTSKKFLSPLTVGARESVEVLDTSNPASARDSDDEAEVSARSARATQELEGAESRARNLDFESEETRVREELDTFVPRTGAGIDHLDEERVRLERIRASHSATVMGREELEAEKALRTSWLADDRSALNLQRVYRGRLGRRRVANKLELTALEKATREAWVEVRDQESGDTWYFNQQTGESQWELPEALLSLVPSSERVKKLPSISGAFEADSQGTDPKAVLESTKMLERSGSLPNVSNSGGAKGRPRSADAVTALPGITSHRDLSNQTEVFRDGVTDYDEEEDLAGGIMSHEDRDRLFLADGNKHEKLRSTVRDTLKMQRFDSVATLLMGPSAGDQDGPLGGQGGDLPVAPSATGADRKPVIGRGSKARKPMVSQLKIGGKSKAKRDHPRPLVGGSLAAGVKDVKSLAIRDVTHPGFDLGPGANKSSKRKGAASSEAGEAGEAGKPQAKVSEICFNCWSAGKAKYCAMHVTEERLGHSKEGSALMCKNWNLDVLLRRYRSEDIQEIFMKSAASLRYDKERKRFVTVEEQKHPIYRGLSSLLSRYNFTVRRKIHQAVWLRSLVEELRVGKIQSAAASKSAAMLKLRNTIFNTKWVRQYASSVAHLHPKGPVTGTTLAERRGLVHHLVSRGDEAFVFALPLPVPYALYLPRAYTLPAPRSIPMPRPAYRTAPPLAVPNTFISEEEPAAWFERFVGRATRECVASAALQVSALSPLPGVELKRRTKYASPMTIKFASLARKPTLGNLAVGGLAAELTVHELVQTLIPPQFGNYTVMHKSAVAPRVSDEVTADFEPKPKDSVMQVFVLRPLQHPLNSRRPPTIMVPTSADALEKHFYGPNRPEQTGEEESFGFRTSAFASGCDALLVKDTNAQAFEPSAEVATPNLPAANQTITTHVDHTYPFCEPSNRNNTTLDFYHLLLFGTCAPNKEQVFTNFGTQQCGEFMRETDFTKPMGPCSSNVYRSWAFVQRQMIEEFVTDDGLPYWFDRKTGETFWERPLAPEELVPVKEGGTVLDRSVASDAEARAEDVKKKYRQDDIRKVILKKHETADEMLDRRKTAAQGAKWARDEGVLKPPVKKAPPATAPNKPSVQTGGGFSSGGQTPHPPHVPPELGSAMRTPNRPMTGGGGHGGGAAADPSVVASITQAMSNLLPQLTQQGATPVDLLQLGMGLGMSLTQGATGMDPSQMMNLQGTQRLDRTNTGTRSATPGSVKFSEPASESVDTWGAPPQPQEGSEPIGVVDPTQSNRLAHLLDHSAEALQHEQLGQVNPELSTEEQFKGMEVVEVTEPPDEQMEGHIMHVSREEEARKMVPVFAYPPELLGADYSTHPLAGAGTAFVPESDAGNQQFVAESKRTLRRAGDVLPEGFFNAIYSTHVGKAEVDYLPTVPNLPAPKPVGRVKPRSAAEDWFAIGFDPWSAGKDPLTREFIPALLTKEEALMEQARKRADDAFIEVMDAEGQQSQAAEAGEQARLAGMFNELASLVRHGKYGQIEEAMNQADFNLPIDYQDAAGSTLLLIAAQNGNKRVSKLFLRRGASINKQNMAGQTVLHYAQSYGFEDLFEYYMGKGADDSLKNADGLTCYEGLNADTVAGI